MLVTVSAVAIGLLLRLLFGRVIGTLEILEEN